MAQKHFEGISLSLTALPSVESLQDVQAPSTYACDAACAITRPARVQVSSSAQLTFRASLCATDHPFGLKMASLPRIDHIIIGAKDLQAAGDHIYNTYGLASYVGGRHQGWGTENIIIPLGEAYLEIAAVFDKAIADKIDWGRWAISMLQPSTGIVYSSDACTLATCQFVSEHLSLAHLYALIGNLVP